jgi:hypothetical protein
MYENALGIKMVLFKIDLLCVDCLTPKVVFNEFWQKILFEQLYFYFLRFQVNGHLHLHTVRRFDARLLRSWTRT